MSKKLHWRYKFIEDKKPGEYLSIEDIAKITNVSKAHIERLIKKPENEFPLPADTTGASFFRAVDISKWLETHDPKKMKGRNVAEDEKVKPPGIAENAALIFTKTLVRARRRANG